MSPYTSFPCVKLSLSADDRVMMETISWPPGSSMTISLFTAVYSTMFDVFNFSFEIIAR
jgi:hypothetical protein